MKLALIDWGRGISYLNEVAPFLADIFSFTGLELCSDVLKIRQRVRKVVRKNFLYWAESLDARINREFGDVIGVAKMPYIPSDEELFGNYSIIYASLIRNVAYNTHNSLVALSTDFLSVDEAKKLGIHEVFELLNGRHETHDGAGPPCANNGATSGFPTLYCSDENTHYYINSLSACLCIDCKKKLQGKY